jgi:hypothetical protein
MSRLLNWAKIRAMSERSLPAGKRFGPSVFSRSAASADVNPSAEDRQRLSAASIVSACHGRWLAALKSFIAVERPLRALPGRRLPLLGPPFHGGGPHNHNRKASRGIRSRL